MECEYNNSCYETAANGDYIEYDWNIENNLEAEFEIEYNMHGEEKEMNVCQGCLADIESYCDEESDCEFYNEKRIRESTQNYDHRRTSKGHYFIQHPWTGEDRKKWIRKWHKQYPHLCKGDKNTFPYKCTNECY